jgi:hypothetical protein
MYKFVQFRCANIRSLVEQIRDITRRAGLRLTMAARADYLGWALAEGQDWPEWVRDGLVDMVLPMNYFTNRETHGSHVRQHAALLAPIKGDCLHLDGVGRLSSFGELPLEQLRDFARDALEAGADGISVFHYGGMKDDDFALLKALRS